VVPENGAKLVGWWKRKFRGKGKMVYLPGEGVWFSQYGFNRISKKFPLNGVLKWGSQFSEEL